MKRRRHRLQVSTFPFLAVLLCAMGSLILLLLILDRRARVVARARAVGAADALATRVKGERERVAQRRQALHEELLRQDAALRAGLARLAGQAGDYSQTLHGVQADMSRLRERLEAEQLHLARMEQQLAPRRTTALQEAGRAQANRTELATLTRDLERLEETLALVKRARERQQQTYSLVPYRGNRGESRRPLYLECIGNTVLIHPERRALQGLDLTVPELRRQISQLLDQPGHTGVVPAGTSVGAPYVFVLVRPESIPIYYLVLAALQGLNVEFGYEFVDRDWLLDFSDGAAPLSELVREAAAPALGPRPQSHALASAPILGVSSPSGVGSGTLGQAPHANGLVPGQLPGGLPFSPLNGGIITPPGFGVPPPNGARTGLAAANNAAPQATRRLGGRAWDNGSLAPLAPNGSGAGGVGPFSPSPPLEGTGVGGGGDAVLPSPPLRGRGVGGKGDALPEPHFSTPPPAFPGASGDLANGLASTAGQERRLPAGPLPMDPPAPTPLVPFPVSTLPPAEQRLQLPALPIGNASASGAAPGGSGAGAAQPGADAQAPHGAAPAGTGGPSGEPSGPSTAAGTVPLLLRPRPSRPAPAWSGLLAGNRDWVIAVMCTAEGAVLEAWGVHIAAQDLAGATGADNPLAAAVRRVIDRRQATVRPGEPPYRPLIHFRVRGDGLRTYYLAYPALEPLGLPMRRESIEDGAK